MCDIICTTDDITSTLSHQTPVFMMSHPLWAWHHNHSIRQRTHCIFVITTSPLISYPLLYDIIPTFVWHPTHYLCDIICTLYNIISTPYVITLLYLCHQSRYIWNHIQYVGPHIHYMCDITANNRCHHSHSIDHITHTLYGITLTNVSHFCTIQDITSSIYDIKPPFLWHHTHYIWHRINCICVITPNILVILHQLNFEISSTIYDDIISIVYDITATEYVSSHPLFQWYYTLCM